MAHLCGRRVGGLLLALQAVVAVSACRGRDSAGGDKPFETRTSALAADAAAIVSTLKARPGSPIAAGVATGFDAVAGGLKPRFAAGDVTAEPAQARVTLPQTATAALHIEDAATSVAVDVSLGGATAVAAQSADGYVVYPGALAAGATVLHRALPGGTEDFVAFDAKPPGTQIAYDLALGQGAAGLRLVGGTLEVLDAAGTPRLRVAPPYIVGANGASTDATLAVAGCAVDTSPAPPWGRPVTAPGARVCQVKVNWPGSGVTYPAILDPRWTTTGSMGTSRQDHTMTLLATGKVLVTGGRSTTGTTGLATAELYDRTTGTWSPTANMTGGRFLHRATQLNTGSNPTTSGKVLISGGLNGTTSLNTAQLYDPTAGTWGPAGTLNAVRHGHTATLLADGKVLVTGGLNGTSTLATAAIYNPASGTGSWAATTGPVPPSGQKNHTAVLLQTPNQQLNNKVLIVGGNSGSATLSAVYLFDPAQSAFSTLASMPAAREGHTMTRLADGKVLVTGGKNGSTTLATTAIFDPGFGPGSWSTAGTMTSARSGHTATLLPASIVANGQVLVAGGHNGSATVATAELFSGTSTWTATPSMPSPPSQGHTAVLLGNNMVLLAGGLNGSTVLGNARLYDAAFGLGCSSPGQCPSGNCVNGVCCDTACNGGCGACNLAGSLGTCTARASGTSCRASAGQCDPAETCNGSSLSCPADVLSPSSTVCRTAAGICDQAENCTGSSAACPTDGKKASGTACPDDGIVCTADTCNGTSDTCQHPAGNAGTVCRGPAGDCDLAASCTGSSATCPANGFKPPSTACPDDGNVCTTDTCNGSSANCQHPAGHAGTVCRDAAADCDLAATCSGSSATCPANPFKPSSTVCRGSNGECDLIENCTGSSASCPFDAKKASGTACSSDGEVCTADVCDGSTVVCQHPPGNAGTVCRAAAGQCDVAETCTGSSPACPGNGLAPNGTSCSDGNTCTGPDTCQSGSCTAGNNTCSSIVVSEAAVHYAEPKLSAALVPDHVLVAPGDSIAFTASVTNSGTTLVFTGGEIDVQNTGSSTFVVGGFQQTLEYQAAGGVWTPFARVVYDAANNIVPETTLLQLQMIVNPGGGSGATYPTNPANNNHATGTSIVAGGNGHWGWGSNPLVPPDVVDIIFDPAQSSGLRAVIRFDMPSGPPQSAVLPLSYPGVTGDINDVAALLFISMPSSPEGGGPLVSSETGPLAPGSTRIFTGTFAAPTLPQFPASPGETQQNYIDRLFASKLGYAPFARVTGHAPPNNPPTVDANAHVDVELPFIQGLTKAGPAAINAGLTGTYAVTLQNIGNAAAGPLTITDSVDGNPVTISDLTAPATIGPFPSATETATFKAASPLARAAGPMTDVAAVTWQDRNGNVYGPLTTSFTGTINAGHPEGYLSVDVATGITDVIGLGKPFAVTALDPYGNPAPGVVVHVVVTGDNPQTANVTTGADGKATFSYSGTTMGDDTVVISATITTTVITLAPIHVQWGSAIGTPCTGRERPLDVMLVIDVSGSMVLENGNVFAGSTGKLEAARAAGDRFIDGLTYPRDQVGVVTFRGGIDTFAQLAAGAANAKTQLENGIDTGISCATNFCPGPGSQVAFALNFALDELQGPRHRPDAQKVLVYIGDGGDDEVDLTPTIARLRASGARAVSIAIGSNIDGDAVRAIADGPNDYFYAPSGAGVDFAFNNLNQDLCRNLAPFVSAGGDQGAYGVRLPDVVTLNGEVHDDGPGGDQRLTSEWTAVSGPGPVTFVDSSAPVTQALFTEPGTYVLQIAASDGYVTVVDRATVTVDPDPSIVGASLVVALGAAGPLETGQSETLTATLTDGLGAPIRNFAVRVTVAGANPIATMLLTNAAGVVTFAYQGAKVGTDVLHATALGSSFQLESNFVSVQWIQPASGGAFLTQGWIGKPADQAKLQERVDVELSPDVTLASGTIKYFAAETPADVHILAANVTGNPGDKLATFDTTLLSNGAYFLQLDGTDDAGNQKTSVVLVTVTGDYKPGRLVVELTDFTIPIAGLPITIGRRYDSLDKDRVGDFGHGWSLVVGHPRLEVNPNFGVSVTLPNERRATFDLALHPAVTGPASFVFGNVFTPVYQGEPGVFGKLTQEGGCPLLGYNPSNPANPVPCFFTGGTVPAYAPEFFTYTDPYGTAHRMAASGELKSITDRQGNSLTFEPNGIISSAGKSVTFVRDAQERITRVLYPAFFGPDVDAIQYEYDPAGDLTKVELPTDPNTFLRTMKHTYTAHRLEKTVDPKDNPVRRSTYDDDGRLATDKDALDNETVYTYDLGERTTTTTFMADGGVIVQKFDARGLLVSEKDQLNRPTTHEYDPDRNEIKRTNALGEETTATYLDGNQTSVTDPTGTTETTYNEQNLPTAFKDRMDHWTTIDYDDRGVPKRFIDELGTRFTFTNSEQGLPLTVDDAEGKRAYLTYDEAGNVTSRTDWLGRVTRATYDEAGNRTSETTAGGGVTKTSYKLDGKPRTTTDPYQYQLIYGVDRNGNTTDVNDAPFVRGATKYEYNALNQLTKVEYLQAGTSITCERDFRGNVTKMIDEGGRPTTYEYDKAGQLIKTTFVNKTLDDKTVETRTYDGLGRLETVTDERGKTTRYGYQLGCGCSDRVTTVTDPLLHTTTTTYDKNGRRTSVEDANHRIISFVYDVRGRLRETHYPDATVMYEDYDPRGRRTSMTDQTGETTFYGYDDQGQLTSVTDPLNNVTAYAYDPDGNLASVTDANNHTTTYAYDLLKRKTRRTLPLTQFETFVYDKGGRLTDHADFRSKTTHMTYDTRDRMLTKEPDASLGETAHVYTYTATGMRKKSTNGSGTTDYGYDLRDRLVTKATPAGMLTYGYDKAGNVKTVVSSNTNGTDVGYAWDDANRLESVSDKRVGGGTPTTDYTHTPTNRPSKLTQPNGVGLTYSYDALDRVTEMLWKQGTSAPFGSWAYTHNERGQRLTSTDITGRAATYTYDSASRLATETVSSDPRGASFNGALSYLLDRGGNRLSRTSTLAALGSQSLTYNADDELDSDAYDANGNTTSSGGHSFAYDFENRLVSRDGGAVTIAYDCDGNRVSKTVGGVTTRFLVDDLNPTGYLQALEEIVGGAVQTRYTYGDRIVSQTRNVSTTPATSYYGFDAHGNITFLTDANGSVTDSYDYDAWGILVASTGGTPNGRLYVGEELDPDLGLINLRARQYTPSTGRFLTIDPLDTAPEAARQDKRLVDAIAGIRNTHLRSALDILASHHLEFSKSLSVPAALDRYPYANIDPINLSDPTGKLTAVQYALIVKLVLASQTLIPKLLPGNRTAKIIGNCAAAGSLYGNSLNLFEGLIQGSASLWGGIVWNIVVEVACLISFLPGWGT